MFCRRCGTENDNRALACAKCGYVLKDGVAVPAPTEKVSNYLVHAILVTVCCCLPFGIVAIVYAAQVNSKLNAGDYAGALESSRKAKRWCWIGLAVGLAINLVVALLQILALASAGVSVS